MTGILVELDHPGDTQLTWSSDNATEVKAARKHFEKLKEKGYLAYRMSARGEQGEVIREFDETAERIVMSPQLVGG